ncbi:uncharacterized protein LOC129612021 [Condylostylus longicornis]|uniref:uncharacterized protein LOC129612021 n=1 Tax=Condylostylus longicornis TaxID=2530218 RepID=UPI00244E46C4|nr:uncharacterized protein LOC129612021 [Condylostylus longicornis]
MDSEFGRAFLFLTNLAWKCRITLPVLVTAVFMVMDIRLQIEINIQAGHLAADANGIEEESNASDDSWETLDSGDEDEEDYEDDGDTDEDTRNEDLKGTNNASISA